MIARLPIRLRLSLLYGITVFVVGAVLMLVAYEVVERNLAVYSHRVASALPRGRTPLPPATGRRPTTAALAAFLERQTRRQQAVEHSARIAAQKSVAVEFLIALFALALPSAGLGLLIAGRALRPVNAITDAARRVGGSDLSERIDLKGPRDELRRLAETFDEMMERLESAFVRQQNFVANASHELRTPLAIVRAELDATLTGDRADAFELQAMAKTIAQATARSEQLLDGLLLLAQSERRALTWTDVSLGSLVQVAIDELAPERVRDLSVRLRLDPAVALGDSVLLGSLVRNLVDNAVRHNLPGGTVEITTRQNTTLAALVIENDGEPIPGTAINALFEPFARLESRRVSKGGAGLGLAIVKAVADAHDGELTASARAEGGLRVEVQLSTPSHYRLGHERPGRDRVGRR
jgi:signal transduction histidine kinase